MRVAFEFMFVFEWIAFFYSLYYYKFKKDRFSLYISLFLGLTVLAETVGHYPMYLDDFDFLSKLKGTRFEKNYWMFNIYTIINDIFYLWFFIRTFKSRRVKKIITYFSYVYVVLAIGYLFTPDVFFEGSSKFSLIVGTTLIITAIFTYYLELLQDDRILYLSKSLTFYVSVGSLFFALIATPAFLYDAYFVEKNNPEFVKIRYILIIAANYILYPAYIVGFMVCTKRLKQGKKCYEN